MITNCKHYILRGSLPKKIMVESEEDEDDSEGDN
jgi:hypothetical protein